MSSVRQFICWLTSIDWTPEAVTAAGTIALAFLTLVLAIGTLFLWFATRRLVKGSEKTAEQQLRAYVVVDQIDLPSVQTRVAPSGQRKIRIAFKNTGETPTRHLAAAINHASFSEAFDIEKFDFPDLPDVMRFFGFIGPNQSVNVPLIETSDEDLMAIKRTYAWFLIWGWIEYNDTFSTHRRRTEFSFRVRAYELPGGDIIWLESTQKHNAADDDCMNPPQPVA